MTRFRALPGGVHAEERTTDRGSAIVEFVLISTLLVLLFIAIVQAALVLHARNVLVADAAEGARAAAVRGGDIADGERTCADLVRHSLPGSSALADEVCHGSTLDGSVSDPDLVRMDARVTLSLTFVPGGRIRLHAVGRAVREPR